MRKVSLLLVCGIVCALNGCGGQSQPATKEAVVKEAEPVVDSKDESELPESQEETKENHAETEEKDTAVGLLTAKIDQTDNLSEDQQRIIQYFDNDYYEIMDYSFLQRYPQVFKGAQIHCTAEITKILSATDEDYQALAVIYDTKAYMAEYENIDENYVNENYVVLNGKQQGMMRIIEGDIVQAYGRYSSVDTYTIDGTSYNIPTINLYDSSYLNDRSRFDSTFIKNVAKSVFGPNIEVRNAVAGEDYTDSEMSWQFGYDPYMICELENQTNSKFTKFRFYTERGLIDDAKGASSEPALDLFTTNIIRKMEFTPDLQHYLVFTYDTDLSTLNIDYYDTEFQKIWNREFENTTVASYDYTEKMLYLVANNDLYMIGLNDGVDTISPVYVGEKERVAKVEDGVLLISNSVNDTVMKVGLDGEILWKTNTSQENEYFDCIQRINGYIVISASNGWNFIIVNEENGNLEAEIAG